MSRARRVAVATLLLVVCVAFHATHAPKAAATTVLFADGTRGTIGRSIPREVFGTPTEFLGGAYAKDAFTIVDYPAAFWPITGLADDTFGASVTIGSRNLYTAAKSVQGPLVIAGVSQGAVAVQRLQAMMNSDSSIPSDTTFILIGDPTLGLLRGLHGVHIPVLDYTPDPLSETRFITKVIVNEYDGWADPIADPANILADLNAVMALFYVHPYAHNSDLDAVSPNDITTTVNKAGGITTTYFVRTKQLPLTMPLRQLLVPATIVDRIDEFLRPVIDAGYDRRIPYVSLSAKGGPPVAASTGVRVQHIGQSATSAVMAQRDRAASRKPFRAGPRTASSRRSNA